MNETKAQKHMRENETEFLPVIVNKLKSIDCRNIGKCKAIVSAESYDNLGNVTNEDFDEYNSQGGYVNRVCSNTSSNVKKGCETCNHKFTNIEDYEVAPEQLATKAQTYQIQEAGLLFKEIQEFLTKPEWELFEARRVYKTRYKELAIETGISAPALRKQFERVLKKILKFMSEGD